MSDLFTYQRLSASLNTRTVVAAILILGGIMIAMVTARFGFIFGIIAGMLPLALFVGFSIITMPRWGMLAIFTVNYFSLSLVRYIEGFMGGAAIDLVVGMTVLGILLQACYQRVQWKNALNGLTIAAGIWLLYCCLEIFNVEDASKSAWLSSIRGVAGYFFVMVILTALVFKSWRDLRLILYVWSVFTILAVLKAYIQKNYGFDSYELRWLFVSGGATTHIIQSGIRYFSIFTDAANFGAAMGCAMVTFSIVAMFIKNKWAKAYFFFVAFLGAYGMMISGTRGALAVPFAGYALYIILSKKWKVIVVMSIAMFGAYVFLNHTMYLHGNANVRRMRSAFNPNDPSLQVRLANQEKIRGYLKDRPFGVGIGMGGGKAKEYAPNAYMSQIPTDSWFVMLWAETGIVGLILYIAIQVYLILKCAQIVMFRIKDRRLRGILAGLLCGIFGIEVSSYGNEILGQFPTGIITYMLFAFIYMGPLFDKQLAEEGLSEVPVKKKNGK